MLHNAFEKTALWLTLSALLERQCCSTQHTNFGCLGVPAIPFRQIRDNIQPVISQKSVYTTQKMNIVSNKIVYFMCKLWILRRKWKDNHDFIVEKAHF